MTGDHLLELFIEGRKVLQAAVDMGIAQHRAAHLHAGFVAFFLVHLRLRIEFAVPTARPTSR
ncbi:hypothetical protein D3C85_1927770 [compost metagenome]